MNISAEANLDRDLLLFPLEGMALRWTRPSQSGPRVKVIATPDLGYACSKTTILEVFIEGLFEYRFN